MTTVTATTSKVVIPPSLLPVDGFSLIFSPKLIKYFLKLFIKVYYQFACGAAFSFAGISISGKMSDNFYILLNFILIFLICKKFLHGFYYSRELRTAVRVII